MGSAIRANAARERRAPAARGWLNPRASARSRRRGRKSVQKITLVGVRASIAILPVSRS